MRKLVCGISLLLLTLAWSATLPAQSPSLDLRRAAPADAYIVVYARHNPERDYQRVYYKQICETVRDTKIVENLLKIVTEQASEDDLQQAKAVWNELREAVAPVDWHAILDCQDFLYAQSMQFPTAQHVAMLRLTPEAAASAEQAVQNLLKMVEKYSEGKVPSQTVTEGEATITTMMVPAEVPFRPTVARLGEVLILASSDQMARQSLSMLQGKGGKSKFDDPRMKDALSRLPEAEDSIVFYDASLQFRQLRGMGQFIRKAGGDDPKAQRAAGLLELLFDELAFLDYEITVEYTEGHRNCSATYGKLLPGAEKKTLYRVFMQGQPFEDWQRWVPADAISYSMSTGANLHPLYERIIEVVNERIPEAQEGLEKFEQIQEAVDVHLDRDLLQAFSGEHVSVTLPAAQPSMLGQDSVRALRCTKPDRIRELLHRLVERLQQIPAVKAQQLQLKESEDLDGFDEVSATLLASFGVRPVIGFRDGWMIIGNNAQAVKKVLQDRAGEGQTIVESDGFKQFGLSVDGPVQSIGYTNLAENTRQAAKVIGQVGFLLPTVLAMAGADADSEPLQQVQKLLALLPSVAQIVEKFDFLEAKLSVTQAAEQPGAYTRRSVIMVRPPSETEP